MIRIITNRMYVLGRQVFRHVKLFLFRTVGIGTEEKSQSNYVNDLLTNASINSFNFQFDSFTLKLKSFVSKMMIDNNNYLFKYSNSGEIPNIYASTYACMVYDICGNIDSYSTEAKLQWVQYFNKFQSEEDGLWYDQSIINEDFGTIDWWGARHLAVHIISAYSALGARPKHPLKYLNDYYKHGYITKWLDETNWHTAFSHNNDIDNKIMNIGSMLLYERDILNNNQATKPVEELFDYLEKRINPQTGMWGYYKSMNTIDNSRMVQFAYHLYILFFHDNRPIKYIEKAIDFTLMTQNELGGYSPRCNSSACEDIDSIYLLIRFSKLSNYRRNEIERSLKKAFFWILSNQNEDGGFVFRRNEGLFYGHENMSSKENESALFPTWFRALAISYILEYFGLIESISNSHKDKIPGY